jgi:mRNA interferase RelE/StbE
MTYLIQVHPDAQAELAALPRKAQRQVVKKIQSLASNPRPPKAKALKRPRHGGHWRLRSGDYRIIYQIRDSILTVLVIKIGDRKDIYRRR